MEALGNCSQCVHWESRPELEMSAGQGYCDFHEKVYKASHSCEFFMAANSEEGRAYKSQIYGGGEDEDDDEMDEVEM